MATAAHWIAGARLRTLPAAIAPVVAGTALSLDALPRAELLDLHAALARDARILRRYRDREHWPRPVLAPPRTEEMT